MATTETVTKRAVTLRLEAGTDAEGNIKYVNQSIGTLSKDRWDGDKVMNIKDAMAPCLSKTVGAVQTVVTSDMTRSS